jgi:signal transduction histidine kinase/CheY-like chemotaxis protein
VADLDKALRRLARQAGLEDLNTPPRPDQWTTFLEAINLKIEQDARDRDALTTSLDATAGELRALADKIGNERDVLNAVLAALSNGIVHLDRAGRVRYANRAFNTMFGVEVDPRRKHISQFVAIKSHLGNAVDPVDVVHKLEPGAVWRDEECRVSSVAGEMEAAIVISPVFAQLETEERLDGFVVSFTDSTEARRTAARIRAAEVEAAAAERAREAQASFLANMSHELRTPLNAIIGYSELVAEEAEDLGYDAILDDLDKIIRSGRHLVGLISDVLDMSKIQAGKLDLETVELDIGSIARDAYESTYPLATMNRNKFEIEIEEPLPPIEADSVRLTQAFVNLIGNAGKFTKDGVITLRVYTRGDGKSVVGEVEDTGIGISSEKLARLFSPFTQADTSTTRKFGGTGLGLAITREVTEAMQGKVEVESEPGTGSVFRLVFPAAGISEVYVPPQPVSRPTRTVESLLVIDDDRATHALIRRHLAETDIVIHSSFSAEEGYKKAREIEPELLFLDILLPGIDGWAMLEHWRSHSVLKHIPFYVISVVNDRPKALREGARGFLNKPIEGDDILAAVTVDIDATTPTDP